MTWVQPALKLSPLQRFSPASLSVPHLRQHLNALIFTKASGKFALMESPAEHASGSHADPITLRLVKVHLFCCGCSHKGASEEMETGAAQGPAGEAPMMCRTCVGKGLYSDARQPGARDSQRIPTGHAALTSHSVCAEAAQATAAVHWELGLNALSALAAGSGANPTWPGL